MQIRERNEEARISRLRRSLLHSSTLALRNARKTLGKERDCSQSNNFAAVKINEAVQKRLYM